MKCQRHPWLRCQGGDRRRCQGGDRRCQGGDRRLGRRRALLRPVGFVRSYHRCQKPELDTLSALAGEIARLYETEEHTFELGGASGLRAARRTQLPRPTHRCSRYQTTRTACQAQGRPAVARGFELQYDGCTARISYGNYLRTASAIRSARRRGCAGSGSAGGPAPESMADQ